MFKLKWKIIPVLIMLFVVNSIIAQPAKIDLSIKNGTLKQFITSVEAKTDYTFMLDQTIDQNQYITVDVKQVPLNTMLEKALSGKKISYEIVGKQIILKPLKTTSVTNEAPKKITGTVTDEKGEPIIGANVVEKGTTNGVVTDVEGKFTLTIPLHAILQVSFIGYNPQEIKVTTKNTLNITLAENTQALDEVVIVAYGVQKKVNVTGAVASVGGDALNNRPVMSAATGLQGMLPGVTITSNSGQPGRPNTNITVRGINTINSNTGPLILIDGVAGGDMDLINPDDIENVSVLKDAASSAIYGARAANGVILVTTKQGKKNEKTKFNYSGYLGIQTPTSLPELVNGRQYMTLENEARAAYGVAIPYSADAFMKYDSRNFPNEYSNTDWIGETYKSHAIQQAHNLSVNGGLGNSTYYMSYGNLLQNGLVVGDGFESRRHNAKMRLTTEAFDRLKLDGNISYIDYFRQEPGSSGTAGVFRLAQRISPLLPVMWQQPTVGGQWEDSPYWSYGSVTNPVYAGSGSGYTKNWSRTFNAIMNATLKIIDDLNVNAQYSYNYYSNERKSWSPTMPKFLPDGSPHAGNENLKNRITESRTSILTQTLTITADYAKSFKKHNFKLLGGYSEEWAYLPTLSASRQTILLDGIEVIDAGTENFLNGGRADHWALRSFFGRLNYDFNEKYLIEGNLRYDGTSRFSKENRNRWGLFPSVSAGWKFSEESFMKFANPVLSMGKLRMSWGELGNQNIGDSYYPYLTSIVRQENSYPIGMDKNVGFKQDALGNKDIKWETIRMFNVGADLYLFDNRLNIVFDWFRKDNINALLRPVYPSLIGITETSKLPLENIASIENKGWEIGLSWRDNIGSVKYSLTANLSDSRNKITDLGNSAPDLGNKIRREGDPIGAYYGYLTNGLAQVTDFESYDASTKKYKSPKFPLISSYADIIQPGDILYKDLSGPKGEPDGKIDDYDKVVFGNPYPRYTFSLRGTMEWNNFDFSFYFQGVGKVDGYLNDEARHAFINDYSIPKTAHLDRWTPNNPGASYPRMYYGQTHNLVYSDYWLEDASYIRLKNIQVGYTIPANITKKLKVDRVKVFTSIDNLFTLSRYFGGFDPEVRESSGDNYPQVKTFAFGVNIGF